MDHIRFHTAGIPLSTKPQKNTENGLRRIKELGLDGMELEYVRGLVMDLPRLRQTGILARQLGLTLTAHAPYYINLFAREKHKVDRSYEYILDTARLLDAAGGYSIVFHAAYYMGHKPENVYKDVLRHIEHIASIARKEALKVHIRPELMGKHSQFGTLDEICRVSRDAGMPILPCVDFAHHHARSGRDNHYDAFARVFDTIARVVGEEALRDLHIHFSGIEYVPSGEKRHLILRESDMRSREFLKCLIDFNAAGVVVCESPNVEGDTLLLKKLYRSME